MKILVCPDKFKGSLTATEVIRAVTDGILAVHPQANVIGQALADGGEGSLDVIRQLLPLTEHRLEVTGPLRKPVSAKYLFGNGKAYIESAEACGLHLVPPLRRDPGFTTTIGVGELIEDALARGATEINLFLGGSSTNDGGAGMAAALGYTFTSDRGHDFVPSGNSLAYVTHIDGSAANEGLRRAKIRAICDVRNPLTGPDGATMVYATQKGALNDDLPKLESNMVKWGARVVNDLCLENADLPGSGAAGGLGFGAVSFLGAELVSGIDWLMGAVRLPELMQNVDLVITGEGRIDEQTLSGKVVAGVGELARQTGIPVWAVCGVNQLPAGRLPAGINRIMSLLEIEGMTSEVAMRDAQRLIEGLVSDELVE